jgi:hypothetical protein
MTLTKKFNSHGTIAGYFKCVGRKQNFFNVICVHTHFHVMKKQWESSESGSYVSAINAEM